MFILLVNEKKAWKFISEKTPVNEQTNKKIKELS
jgi:hypothetical protein